MQYRKLGTTDLEISRLILGCGNFGGVGSDARFFGMGETEREAHSLMDHAWDLGITVFDTADAYGGGRSERTIGRWLKNKSSAVRDRLIVSSKVGNAMGEDDGHGLSAVRIARQVEASLDRLGTDHLDMYLTHEPDPDTALRETLQSLTALTHAGKIRCFGASNINMSQLDEALSIGEQDDDVDCFGWVQNNYSLLERSQENSVMPRCAEEKLGFTPFSPLAGGWLTGKYQARKDYPEGSRMTLRPDLYRHIECASTFSGLTRLCEAALERDVSMATLSMAWILAHTDVTGIVIGPRNPSQLAEACAALQIEMTRTERITLADLFS